MTITEFLLARIAEDREAALGGISSQADPENGWGYGDFGSPTALTPHVGIIHEGVQAAHIIRWHPARVLAECEAKRRIVDRYSGCDDCGAGDDPCDALRFLALPYADHPDYRQEWRP